MNTVQQPKIKARPSAIEGSVSYVSRPRTKPTTSTRGKLNEWDNGYKEFVPAGTKDSNRQMIKQIGESSFYKNEGKKESSYSLHLNVDAASADPIGEMVELFNALTCEMNATEPLQISSSLRVVNERGLECWLDSSTNVLTFTGRIDLSNHPRDWQAEILRMVQLIVRRLPASERFNNIINNLKCRK